VFQKTHNTRDLNFINNRLEYLIILAYEMIQESDDMEMYDRAHPTGLELGTRLALCSLE
jgi:hypothetical protein